MTNISISGLKANPKVAISASFDYPVAITSRNETKAYLLGVEIFEKLISRVEDMRDLEAAKKADFSSGTELNDFIEELGL